MWSNLQYLYKVGENIKWYRYYGKQYEVPQKFYDPAIPLLVYVAEESKAGFQRDVHTPINIADSQEPRGRSNPSVHQWMNKQNVLYTYNEIQPLKKEGNFDICYNVDEP